MGKSQVHELMSDTDKSLEETLANVARELDRIAPQDPSLWLVVQLSREWILKQRKKKATWAQIAGAFRAAGFPGATESNVRLACRKPPTQKARNAASTKERARQPTQTPDITAPTPTSSTTSTSTSPSSGPRLLKPRY